MSFIESLEISFQKNSQPLNAIAMAKYMRNHFMFFGIKTQERRLLLKAICNINQEEVEKNQGVRF
ncbi:MAG: hypothetical protein RL528_617 [Bacteroidota bacterium]|jgi:3-methyladenine DNA glycosylase AlkD